MLREQMEEKEQLDQVRHRVGGGNDMPVPSVSNQSVVQISIRADGAMLHSS